MKKKIIRIEQHKNSAKLLGLKVFKESLENHFLSAITIRNSSANDRSMGLVIEMDCNYKLREILFSLKNIIPGNTFEKKIDRVSDFFSTAFKKLQDNNEVPIDIEELSIYLKDTSIIIRKIYKNSILHQLKNLINALNIHSKKFTEQHIEVPFEICIPVFEMNKKNRSNSYIKAILNKNNKTTYFKNWGLYYDSEKNDVIYNLRKQSLIHGEIHYLNY
ncbi:hypothetical protein [Maribacter luteus]|uniref:hypothetical protein n=1 Tax=Maribacter luteus TaxID=2594478 RepID=UPI002492CB99|nr:hypothetical protein [Maribacter luteus]